MAAPKAPALFRAEHLPLLETLPFVLCAAYVFLCPFHKVEESFHLQVRAQRPHRLHHHHPCRLALDRQLWPLTQR